MSCKGEEPQQHTTTNSEEIASKSNSYEFINILNEDSKGEGKK
jgi:DNA-binding transcriptional MerR regulator